MSDYRISIDPDTWTRLRVFLSVAQDAIAQERQVYVYSAEEIGDLISSLKDDIEFVEDLTNSR